MESVDNDLYTEAALKQYLLGEVSDEERERIELRYLANEDFFDRLLGVEDDLMDEYVRGDLSPAERERFEQKLLATPKQREKLRQTRHLLESLGSHRLDTQRAIRREAAKTSRLNIFKIRMPVLAGAFVVLVLTIGVAWLLVRQRKLNAELQRMQSERAGMQQQQLNLQSQLSDEQREKSELLQQLQSVPRTQPSKESPTTPAIATFILPLTLSRGGEATSFSLKQGVNLVQLQAPLVSGDYKSYNAQLQSADGASLNKFTGLKSRKTDTGRVLLLRIPARALTARDYVLRVSGVNDNSQLEDVGFYSFRIVRN